MDAKTLPARDSRVDLLRGLSLLSIFVDHIPGNRLADFTLHAYGFSDAAELFVSLAGFSATMAYGRIFERDGMRVGLAKIAARCFKIYAAQVVLLLITLMIVALWARQFGFGSTVAEASLRGGLHGLVRGLTLKALPAYLDILPLYILLLAAFPLVYVGLARSLWGTIAASVALHALANIAHMNLPNIVDPRVAAWWYFNPFTWQLVFVLGAALAFWTRARAPLIVRPSRLLRALAWVYLVFAFVAMDFWKLWPNPFGPDFPGPTAPFALFGNEPKSYVTPWRLAHILALLYIALTSERLIGIARSSLMRPIVACGRNSLEVFAAGCFLALVSRLAFSTFGATADMQFIINGIGLAGLIVLGVLLERVRIQSSDRRRAALDGRPVDA